MRSRAGGFTLSEARLPRGHRYSALQRRHHAVGKIDSRYRSDIPCDWEKKFCNHAIMPVIEWLADLLVRVPSWLAFTKQTPVTA